MSNLLPKVVEAIDHIADHPRGLSVTDLAERMATSKSTASRLLASLVEAGLVEKDDAQRHFLDVRFWHWGVRSVRRITVLDVARPHIVAAVKRLGVSVYVTVAREDKAIYLESIALLNGDAFLNLVSYIVPIYACAPGKALLAHAAPELVESVLDGPLEQFTPQTFASREELSQELARVREQGYATNRGEYSDNGRLAIAVPVFDQTGLPVASICFYSVPDEQAMEKLVTPLKELGATVSSSLGYSQSVHAAVG